MHENEMNNSAIPEPVPTVRTTENCGSPGPQSQSNPGENIRATLVLKANGDLSTLISLLEQSGFTMGSIDIRLSGPPAGPADDGDMTIEIIRLFLTEIISQAKWNLLPF